MTSAKSVEARLKPVIAVEESHSVSVGNARISMERTSGTRGRQRLGLFDYKRSCEICGKVLKNSRSISTHRYKYHKK